jgi:hypothetical protein
VYVGMRSLKSSAACAGNVIFISSEDYALSVIAPRACKTGLAAARWKENARWMSENVYGMKFKRGLNCSEGLKFSRISMNRKTIQKGGAGNELQGKAAFREIHSNC